MRNLLSSAGSLACAVATASQQQLLPASRASLGRCASCAYSSHWWLLCLCSSAQLFTQFILISLLWAPNSGGLSLMGDVAQVMVDQVKIIMAAGPAATSAAPTALGASSAAASASSAPVSWLLSGKAWLLSCLADGQRLMVLATVLVVLPLSCQKHMRSLETAAAVGMMVVFVLLAVLMVGALDAGLPAIKDGQVPLWSLKVGHYPQLPAWTG